VRMLLKVTFPAEEGSEAYRSGAMKETFESAAETLKPEAAYFYPEDGKRTALYVFDMEGSLQLPAMVEPMFQNLGASVLVTPCMNAEDLERGLEEAGI
jgi:hypothetical protein